MDLVKLSRLAKKSELALTKIYLWIVASYLCSDILDDKSTLIFDVIAHKCFTISC